MSESILNKEFRESDVNRIRNLVTKKYGEKTKTQVGYTKSIIERKEGEIWTENNKLWTIKNGLKVSFSKLEIIKKTLKLPLICPCCSNLMEKKLDRKMYFIHKKCFDCVIKYETKLRIEGKYEQYCQNILKSNANSFIDDLEDELNEFLKKDLESFITEQGDIEDWEGSQLDKTKINEEIKEYIKNIRFQLGI